ncbi:Peramine synthetase ppzA [Fulvia fulva]|uniref:Peramine synthetase ppzA n=1 Tax=Passalora fulva TaxID=5499 RepID=A0A9Q8LF94_PASFU|nr:Peramine synthetase ppzA [Fulvia fulva]UJO16346.1 Peramine synthetase ppzA [Fulvia fulva]
MPTSADLDQIWRWNASVPACEDRLVHDILRERAVEQPDRPAICAWDGTLTYARLNELATDLARRLVCLGFGPGPLSIVPLCFEKSMWTAVAMLGVLKAGAGFVLLDPQQPEQRLRTIVKQTNAGVIVSSVDMSCLSLRLVPTSIVLSWRLFEQPSDATGIPLQPDTASVAYIAFTSGSTGEPKGAMISHRNISSALLHQHQPMGFTPGTRFYDFSSYSFDASIGIFFTTLAAGGCICVPSEDDRRNNLIESINALGANTLDLTPSVAALLSPAVVPGANTLILGGEALQARDLIPWWVSVRVMSFYGPCECTPTSTINYDARTPKDATHLGSGVGLLTWLAHPQDHHVLVPIGDVGEILLEGPLVGLGYLLNSERTAESFVEDPVWLSGIVPGRRGRRGRLHKTGDLARYQEDGSLVFVGRKDTQSKVRGQRVELREIEDCLREHPEINDAVAVVHKDTSVDSEWITAFVTVHHGGDAFQAWSSLSNWQNRLTTSSTSSEKTHHAASKETFASWCSIRNASNEEIGQLEQWLKHAIDPVASELEESQSFDKSISGPFVLFSMPTVQLPNIAYARSLEFVGKIIDSLPAVENRITLLKAAPTDLDTQCLALSPGLIALLRLVWMIPELLVHPLFFASLVERLPNDVAHVEAIPDEPSSRDYLGPCCYTAIVHFKREDTRFQVQQPDAAAWIDFRQEKVGYQGLANTLQERRASEPIVVTNIPYSRIVEGRKWLQQVQSGVTQLSGCVDDTKDSASLSVPDLANLARAASRQLQVTWIAKSSLPGALTASFYHDTPITGRVRPMFHLPSTAGQQLPLGTLCTQPTPLSLNHKVERVLLELLRIKLPSYMIPSVIRVVEKIPLNKNCKIDRKSLEDNVQRRRRREDAMTAGSKTLSNGEEDVRRIWASALRIEPATIGRNDRFFDIGGDSITAMKVVLGARECGLRLTVRDVFLLEIHEMAERISALPNDHRD